MMERQTWLQPDGLHIAPDYLLTHFARDEKGRPGDKPLRVVEVTKEWEAKRPNNFSYAYAFEVFLVAAPERLRLVVWTYTDLIGDPDAEGEIDAVVKAASAELVRRGQA